MPGIAGISKEIEQRKTVFESSGKEVFVLDGQTVAFSVLSTGEDENVDHVYRHWVNGAGRNGNGRYVFCRSAVEEACWVCDSSFMDSKAKRPQMMFAFWAYVHSIRSDNKPKNPETWTEKTQRNKTFWEMEVNEPRIISLPVGRDEITWDSFIEIHQMGNGGDGGFDKVIHLSRKGGGKTDTSYRLTPTSVDVNPSALPNFTDMESLKGYFLTKANSEDAAFGQGAAGGSSQGSGGSVPIDDEDDSDLPF